MATESPNPSRNEMTTDYEKIEKVNELMEKDAFVGAVVGAASNLVGKGAWAAGKTVVKNPVAAFNVMDTSKAAIDTARHVGDSKMHAAMNIDNAVTGATF